MLLIRVKKGHIGKNTTNATFVMPNLTTITIKALQLEALQTVRHYASKQYKDLFKQKEQMTTILRGLNNSTHRGRSLHTGALSDDNNDTTTHGQSYFQQRASLAESTTSCYNNNNSNDTHVYKSKDTKVEKSYTQTLDYNIRMTLRWIF